MSPADKWRKLAITRQWIIDKMDRKITALEAELEATRTTVKETNDD